MNAERFRYVPTDLSSPWTLGGTTDEHWPADRHVTVRTRRPALPYRRLVSLRRPGSPTGFPDASAARLGCCSATGISARGGDRPIGLRPVRPPRRRSCP